MAFSFKYLKKRFVNYAFDQLADGVNTQNKLRLLLAVIIPEAFSDFSIYAFPYQRIKAFTTNIETTSNILKDITLRIDRKESLVSVFDSLEAQSVDVHTFFTDSQGCYADVFQFVTTIVESLTMISHYLDEDEDESNISIRRNQAIIKSNLTAFIDFIESLYLLQKKLS